MWLVVAGGHDPRLAENREYLAELKAAAAGLGVAPRVLFVPSFSAALKLALLRACVAVLYTPQREHFGIVPLEAMAAGRPVLACDSGGPTESIAHRRTGFLCEPTPSAFSAAMQALLADGALAGRMGRAARAHVCARFSRDAFGAALDAEVRALATSA